MRTALASIALAAGTIPASAGDRLGPVTKEDPNAIRPFRSTFLTKRSATFVDA